MRNKIYYMIILLMFLSSISSITALSLGSGIKINITINNTGMNFTNYTTANYTNYTANPFTNQSSNPTSQNNQTNTNNNINANINNTNNNENQPQNSTGVLSSQTTRTKSPIIQTNSIDSTNTNEQSTTNHDNEDTISESSTSQNKKSIEISKIVMILPTLILTDLFVITYALYKSKENNKIKRKNYQ